MSLYESSQQAKQCRTIKIITQHQPSQYLTIFILVKFHYNISSLSNKIIRIKINRKLSMVITITNMLGMKFKGMFSHVSYHYDMWKP